MKKKNTNKIVDWRVLVSGIFALTVIECFAMYMGINGTFRMTVTAIIAAAIGIALPLKTK